MPIYRFDCFEGQREPDLLGTVCADDDAAHAEAVRYAGDVLKADPRRIWDAGSWRIRVSNERGVHLFTVTISGIEASENQLPPRRAPRFTVRPYLQKRRW